MSNVIVEPDGHKFGPNASGKIYISLNYHRSGRTDKSNWCVSRQKEYEIFCAADTGNWSDFKGNYWGVGDPEGRTELGTKGELICKFPRTSNTTDPWHGFPVHRDDHDKHAPPLEFVEQWIALAVVTKTFGRRIQKGKV